MSDPHKLSKAYLPVGLGGQPSGTADAGTQSGTSAGVVSSVKDSAASAANAGKEYLASAQGAAQAGVTLARWCGSEDA